MKKYDLSKIMKRAWEIKKENKKNIFSICLQLAWEEAKKAVVKFKNGMELVVDGRVYMTLRRWTKGNHDRVYINDGTRKGCGYIDLIEKEEHINSGIHWSRKEEVKNYILSMEF